MCPRLDHFKKCVFTHRVSIYNETFCPLGKNIQINGQTYAALWHEGISGRRKENIISTFENFIQATSLKEYIFFMDNCAAQNKNWAFLSALVYFVNCMDLDVESILINYLEPGHTFMSADSFHAQVERKLREQKSVYDYPTFVDCVRRCSMHQEFPIVMDMNCTQFKNWKDEKSAKEYDVYLRNICALKATKGQMHLMYKEEHAHQTWKPLNFIKRKVLKYGFEKPVPLEESVGIDATRRNEILKNLGNLMPAECRFWWQNVKIAAP
jgi:hypothetical protein